MKLMKFITSIVFVFVLTTVTAQDFHGVSYDSIMKYGLETYFPKGSVDRTADTLYWTFNDKTFNAGDTVEVKFYVQNFVDVGAFQYTMKWDTLKQNLRNPPFTFTGAIPGYSSNKFSYWGKPGYNLLPGEIRTLWTNPYGKTVNGGANTFTHSVWFVAKQSGNVCSCLSMWNKAPLWPVAYKSNLSYFPESVKCVPLPAPLTLSVQEPSNPIVVYPNPATDYIFVEGADAVEIYNTEGMKTHDSSNGFYFTGLTKGVNIVRTVQGNTTQIFKVIKL